MVAGLVAPPWWLDIYNDPPVQPPKLPPLRSDREHDRAVMDVEEACALAFVFLKSRKRRVRRRFWIHPFVRDRSARGVFFTHYVDLRNNPDKFFSYTRMSVATFDELFKCVKDQITGQTTILRDSIPPEEKLLVTLSYLGSGISMVQLHIYYRVGRSTIGNIIRQVTTAIWMSMKLDCFPDLNAEKWKCIAEDFSSVSNFPNCIGALDGKHIRVVKPCNSGSMYYNYKHYCSIVLLAMCDANYLFTFIDVGGYGKESDSTIFKASSLNKALQNKTLQLPQAKPISTSSVPLPYVIVADEAFALSDHIMRPYPRKALTVRKKVFNYRLSRARRFIECAFGLLNSKWQILQRSMNVDVLLTEDIVKACCILHNFVRSREGYKLEETLNVTGFQDLRVDMESRSTKQALNVRDKFADYFYSPDGALEWQYRVV